MGDKIAAGTCKEAEDDGFYILVMECAASPLKAGKKYKILEIGEPVRGLLGSVSRVKIAEEDKAPAPHPDLGV